MKVIHDSAELNAGTRKVCVAIGVFDGVHLGHQQVIRQSISDALQNEGISVVITFDRHPSTVVAPERAPEMIYPLEKKLEVIASLGVDATWLIHFDKAFSEISGEEFVRLLVKDFKPVYSICVGSGFTFGKGRSGNVPLLNTLGKEFGFKAHSTANLALNGNTISSTRVREAVRSEKLDLAGQLLGRPYSLCGRVIEGDRLGRTFGFPTANLDTTGLVLPPLGVYAAHARVQGQFFRAVVNLGRRPTLRSPAPRLQVEAHLLDFHKDIYGEPIELVFVQKLRDEEKFASVDALKEQIKRDIANAQALF